MSRFLMAVCLLATLGLGALGAADDTPAVTPVPDTAPASEGAAAPADTAALPGGDSVPGSDSVPGGDTVPGAEGTNVPGENQPGGQGAKGEGEGGSSMGNLIFFALPVLLVIMIWSQMRQSKKQKAKQQEMQDNSKIGARVVTVGGMHGEIVRKGEGTVDIKVDEGAVITFDLAAIARFAADPAEETK